MTHFAELATIYETHYAKVGTGQYYSQPHGIPEKWCDSKTLNLIGAPGGDCRRTMDQEILVATSWTAEKWAFIPRRGFSWWNFPSFPFHRNFHPRIASYHKMSDAGQPPASIAKLERLSTRGTSALVRRGSWRPRLVMTMPQKVVPFLQASHQTDVTWGTMPPETTVETLWTSSFLQLLIRITGGWPSGPSIAHRSFFRLYKSRSKIQK